MKPTDIIMTKDLRTSKSEYGGITDKVMAKVKDRDVMIKGWSGESTDPIAELFTYRLGRMMGFGINKVKVIDCGDLFGLSKVCSVHWWEYRFIPRIKINDGIDQVKFREMQLFDTIIDNSDRHSENYGKTTHDGRLFLIDNGYAKPWNTNLKDTIDWKRWINDNRNDCLDFMTRFLRITEDQFIRMFRVPEDFSMKTDTLAIKTVSRMTNIQNLMREVLL